MPLPWLSGKVIQLKDETPNTRRFWIEIPELQKFDFVPGQFITFDLPVHEQKNKRLRSYSIASWPNDTNVIELIIVLVEGGLGTRYLFNEVSVGSELILRGPQGVFVLPPVIEKDLYFICTGTGIAPFRAMARHIYNHNIPHKNIYLIFGCQKLCDTLYKEEMLELETLLESFKYLPTYSREIDNNSIRKGYVHNIYEEICTLNKSSIDQTLKPAHFNLCGWKNMIDEARQRIVSFGYDKKDIHQELYG